MIIYKNKFAHAEGVSLMSKTQNGENRASKKARQKKAQQAGFYVTTKKSGDMGMAFAVFVLSLLFPGLGIIFFKLWREDNPFAAKVSLGGFSINAFIVLWYFGTILYGVALNILNMIGF